MPSPERLTVRRAALIARRAAGDAKERVARLAAEAGVELLPESEIAQADLVIVLGGDGSVLRALQSVTGRGVPVFGVNFGRVGFLTTAEPDELETAVRRALAGELQVVELATVQVERDGVRVGLAVNDVVVASDVQGRIARLGWNVDGVDLGELACDAVIVCTPAGSTGYGLSAGGPVLDWGVEALGVTFVAPHTLTARPLVLPRGARVEVANRARELPVRVILDGVQSDRVLAPGESVTVSPGAGAHRARAAPRGRLPAALSRRLHALMLEELVVENLVLVRSARLTLHPGLNVLTGETGAGKTILAEAVGLLLGGRADASLVGPAGAEAYVEATFSDVELPEELAELAPEDAEGVVVARRVGREGRSRALLYGRSCTRDDLERIGQSLIEMVSQHEARRLVRPAVQLDLLDASAGDKLAAAAQRDGSRLARARRRPARARRRRGRRGGRAGAPGRAARARRGGRGGRSAAGRGGRPRARAQPPAPPRRAAGGRARGRRAAQSRRGLGRRRPGGRGRARAGPRARPRPGARRPGRRAGPHRRGAARGLHRSCAPT